MAKFLFTFLLSLFTVECLIENKEELYLTFEEMRIDTVGKIGTAVAYFHSNQQHNIVDINKKTCFTTQISDGKGTHDVKCGLWTQGDNSNIFIFCNIESNIPSGNYYIFLNETKSFTYNDYTIILENCDDIKFKKLDQNIIDLYGGNQTLQIEDTIDTYELKFNIVSYNQEPIFLKSEMPLDNCRNENNILICPMTKRDLLAYLTPEDNQASISYINYDDSLKYFPLIPRIKIIIKEFQKKDIFVKITKLLVNVKEADGEPIVYETNVTDISNIYFYEKSGKFELTFKTKEEKNEIEESVNCNFVKYDNDPLYIICWLVSKGTSWLKEITEEKEVKNTNIQYNFRILPVNNNETMSYIGVGTAFYWSYPKILDFTKNNGPYSILYSAGENPEYLKGLTFNENGEDLKCKITSYRMRCEVPKSHFQGKEKGFYYLKYMNNITQRAKRYEV